MLKLPGWVRDRREAASDEIRTVTDRNGRRRPIYGVGSRARHVGAGRARGFDRSLADIQAIVLHQTAGSALTSQRQALPEVDRDGVVRSSHRVDKIIAHFVVLLTGNTIYTHDVRFFLNDAGGRHGIDIEFAGRFGHDSHPGGLRLTHEAIRRGRALLTSLRENLPNLRYIHPHGQIQTPDREGHHYKLDSCPGPDIWVNIGEWAVRRFGLTAEPVNRSLYRHDWTITDRQSNPAYDQGVD